MPVQKTGFLRHALGFALGAVLFLLCLGPAAAEEVHTVLLTCEGGGFVGRSEGKIRSFTLCPETRAKAADGTVYPLEELRSLPGFRVTGASLRWTAADVDGIELRYALALGRDYTRMLRVLPGRNFWDITDLFRAWLENPEEAMRLLPMHWEDGKGLQVVPGTAKIQFTFSADGPLPLFPMDRIREDAVYEAGFSLLEDGNIFLRQYDEVADSLLTARLPLGVPYYYAGRSEEKFLHRFHPETTTNYYRYENLYFCGLDCVGMTRLVYEKSGLERHPSIVDILHGEIGTAALRENDPSVWPAFLQPGDLIGVKHGYYHVMMYLGTLRQFGWTEATAGDAAPVLDAPLVLHCGGNPFYYDRYLEYIREMGYERTYPPDGGVTVSVIQPSIEKAPHRMVSAWEQSYGWYEIKSQPLLVFPLDDCTMIAWYSSPSR